MYQSFLLLPLVFLSFFTQLAQVKPFFYATAWNLPYHTSPPVFEIRNKNHAIALETVAKKALEDSIVFLNASIATHGFTDQLSVSAQNQKQLYFITNICPMCIFQWTSKSILGHISPWGQLSAVIFLRHVKSEASVYDIVCCHTVE